MADQPRQRPEGWEGIRDEWIVAVKSLVDEVESWCKELGLATRRSSKAMDDSRLGGYALPMLLMQDQSLRFLLEPIARFIPGGDGLVDLYLMPAYDDVASIVRRADGWHYAFVAQPSDPASDSLDERLHPFTREALQHLIQAMAPDHAQA